MTARRDAAFDLKKAVLDPGFTPRVRDAAALLELLADEALAVHAERALLRAGPAAAPEAIRRVADEAAAARPLVLRVLGRMAAEADDEADAVEAIHAALIAALADADERVRRAAAVAIGKASGQARSPGKSAGSDALAARREAAEQALAAAIAREPSASARRAMVEAIGKVGGEAALAALRGAAEGDVTEGRARARAALIVTRTVAREVASSIDASRPAETSVKVALRCRPGLEPILADELSGAFSPKLVGTGPGGPRVEVTLRGAPADLFAARTFLSFGFLLPTVRAPSGDPAGAIAASITSPEALAILRRWTVGPLRYRIAWASGGKRRATVWRVAEEALRRCRDLVNDPTDSPWEAVIHEGGGALTVELVPRVDDPRFAYRRGDVPAASHPTIAAALVRVAGVREDDVVWDPFVGSGVELCERAIAGPYKRLVGSDVAPEALEIARQNLDAAGAKATLLTGDAASLKIAGSPPTLVITNPPMGRRVHRSADLGALLDRFLRNAARALAPGGRLVWISPFPEHSRGAAADLGLSLGAARMVDMGGFSAEIQAFGKSASASERGGGVSPRGRGSAAGRR